MLPFSHTPYNLQELASAVLKGNNESVAQFEKEVADKFGFPHALFFPNGRSALWTFLKAIKQPSKSVLLPAYSCPAVVEATLAAGMLPEFMDCSESHFNVDEKSLVRSLNSSVKTVVLTSLFGYPIDYRAQSKSISDRIPDCQVIYDVAQGFSMLDDSDFHNTASTAFIGLGEGKVISTVSGGVLLTTNTKLINLIKVERDAAFAQPSLWLALKNTCLGVATNLIWRWPFNQCLGKIEYLYRKLSQRIPLEHDTPISLDAQTSAPCFQAELGKTQLKKYERFLHKRLAIATAYETTLRENGIFTFTAPPGTTYSHFPLLVKDSNTVIDWFNSHGIGIRPPFKQSLPELMNISGFPSARKMVQRIVCLPIWPGMTKAQVQATAEAITHVNSIKPQWFYRYAT